MLTLEEKRELVILSDRRDLRRSFAAFARAAWKVIEPATP